MACPVSLPVPLSVAQVITVLPLAGGLPEALAFSLAAGMLLCCLGLIGVVRQAEAHSKEGHVLVACSSDTETGTSSDDSETNYAEPHDEGTLRQELVDGASRLATVPQ